MDHGPPITWDDIAGLEFAKNTIQEIVIWPMLRPYEYYFLNTLQRFTLIRKALQ